MLIKLLVLPLFPFLHSSFQPFSFITSLPVYICPFHQSLSISVHVKLVCAPSPHSADKGRGTEISCIVVLMLVQVKNSKPICVFVISVCACCHREFIHPGRSNSLLTHHWWIQTRGHCQNKKRDISLYALAVQQNFCFVIHSDKLGCNKLWLSAVEEGEPPYMIAWEIPRGITIILSLLLEAIIGSFPGLTCLQFFTAYSMQKCFCIY